MMDRNFHRYRPTCAPENIFLLEIWSVKDHYPIRQKERILPKGTAEIIFNLSDAAFHYRSTVKSCVTLPSYFINGVHTRGFELSVDGLQHFIGIQIPTFALKYLFKIPATELSNQFAEGALVCPTLQPLYEQIGSSNSCQEQLSHILLWLRNKINKLSLSASDDRVIQFNTDREIKELSVGRLSDKYNVTPRHLNRLCHTYFGMSAEDMVLYQKYLTALHLTHDKSLSLTEIAYHCGFYDQAHFSRTFKLFTGLTANGYRKAAGFVTGHIFEREEIPQTEKKIGHLNNMSD